MSERFPKPAPVATPETEPYWEGCRKGELRLQRCAACERIQFPPRRYCAGCLSDDLAWERASGRGQVRSYTIVRVPMSPAFAADVPYAVALVELPEGTRIVGNVSGDPKALYVGMPVEVEFVRVDDTWTLPAWRPEGDPRVSAAGEGRA